MNIKTKNGFECEIEDKVLDDYELVEALTDMEENPLAIKGVVDKLFGKSKAKAFDFIREKHGYVSTKEISQLVIDIFNGIKNGKNS